jgi:hypothetical protein
MADGASGAEAKAIAPFITSLLWALHSEACRAALQWFGDGAIVIKDRAK